MFDLRRRRGFNRRSTKNAVRRSKCGIFIRSRVAARCLSDDRTPLDGAFREFGPYHLERILGEGGMGVVWLARRKDTGHLVAIKFLPHAGLSPARRERFARETGRLPN